MKKNGTIDQEKAINQSAITVPLKEIHLPSTQPRRYFNSQSHQRLIRSIQTHGVLQPLLVRPRKVGGYELVAGERRYRAAIAAELVEVPVSVQELSDAEAIELALIENLLREELNPLEEIEGIIQLLAIRLNCPTEEVPLLLHQLQHQHKKQARQASNNVIESKEQYGEDQISALDIVETVFESLQMMSWISFVNNRLPLLNLPSDVLEALRFGRIEYTKAKVIAQLKDLEQRQQLLEQAIAQQWSLNRIREQVKALHTQPSTVPLKQRVDNTYQLLKRTKLWEHPEKQNKLETLLTELETLLQDEPQ
ncbi:ParB/RepB/Spo0J family partition protein [Oscillatoria sp. FACHB-1407]|uniref:ParB/RepB/Spo0J family partition protein n=1 Tax=Oscillatoria sp. FACHB-1407 TaxID=2692847 RepID=UPI0018EFB4BE|nr:ParB/RepB/Spo0J family partition protein [Oscillatoria sp. FACHB-1407]MBD2463012.1 ParB/RepB/Spo0J family partition protein [Oscillatoria sp. FACHB-1407]